MSPDQLWLFKDLISFSSFFSLSHKMITSNSIKVKPRSERTENIWTAEHVPGLQRDSRRFKAPLCIGLYLRLEMQAIRNDVFFCHNYNNWAAAWDFQQFDILTSVDSDEPLHPLFKLRGSKMVFSQLLNTHRILKRLAKALIRLRVCAGWSEALLIAHTTLLEISCIGSLLCFQGWSDPVFILFDNFNPHLYDHRLACGCKCSKRN